MSVFNYVITHYIVLINMVLTFGISIHGVCVINHMNKKTPFVKVLGMSFITVGAFAVVTGVFFGHFSNEPQEVLLNAGVLILLLYNSYENYKLKL